MGISWAALRDSFWADVAYCVDLSFWVRDFCTLRKMGWVVYAFYLLALSYYFFPYYTLVPFKATWYFWTSLHLNLFSLYSVGDLGSFADPVDKEQMPEEDKGKDTGKGNGECRPKKHKRQPSYGLVQPVVGQSAGPIRR